MSYGGVPLGLEVGGGVGVYCTSLGCFHSVRRPYGSSTSATRQTTLKMHGGHGQRVPTVRTVCPPCAHRPSTVLTVRQVRRAFFNMLKTSPRT